MTTETNNFEIFFSLIEKRGEKTEQLINDIARLAEKHNIQENVTFSGINHANTAGDNQNKIIYSISLPSATTPKAADVMSFLSYIFNKMFEKFPAFTEPDFI